MKSSIIITSTLFTMFFLLACSTDSPSPPDVNADEILEDSTKTNI